MIGEKRYGSTTNKPSPTNKSSSIVLKSSKPLVQINDSNSTPIFPITQPNLQLTEPANDLFTIDTYNYNDTSTSSTQYSSYSHVSQSYQYTTIQLIILCCISIISGVGNNIAFVQMGIHMPMYPASLLILTTLLYVLIFSVWLMVQSNNNTNNTPNTPKYANNNNNTAPYNESNLYLHYTMIALLVVIGGILSQYSNVFVGGSIQSLINQLTLPIVTVLLSILYKHKYTLIERCGVTIVLIGSCIGIICPLYDDNVLLKPAVRHDELYASQFNNVFWVIMFVMSDIPSALTNVYEDYLFTNRIQPVNEIHYLCWSNIISLLGYVMTIPCMLIPKIGNLDGMNELWRNQVDALICVFTSSGILPDGCSPNSYLPIISFVICVVIYFYCLAVLIRQQNPIYQIIVQALITPISAIAFSSTTIMHTHAESLSHYTIVACILIPIGIAIYKYNDVVRVNSAYDILSGDESSEYNIHSGSTTNSNSSLSRLGYHDTDSEMLPLIARH